MNNKIKSLIFDFFQITSLTVILLTGPVITSNLFFIFCTNTIGFYTY